MIQYKIVRFGSEKLLIWKIEDMILWNHQKAGVFHEKLFLGIIILSTLQLPPGWKRLFFDIPRTMLLSSVSTLYICWTRLMNSFSLILIPSLMMHESCTFMEKWKLLLSSSILKIILITVIEYICAIAILWKSNFFIWNGEKQIIIIQNIYTIVNIWILVLKYA